MVEGEEQDLVVGCQTEQANPQQGTGRQVEGCFGFRLRQLSCACFPLCGWQILQIDDMLLQPW